MTQTVLVTHGVAAVWLLLLVVVYLLFTYHLVHRQDGNRSNLRNAAYEALGELIKYSPRVSAHLSDPKCKHPNRPKWLSPLSHWQLRASPAPLPSPWPAEPDVFPPCMSVLCLVGLLRDSEEDSYGHTGQTGKSAATGRECSVVEENGAVLLAWMYLHAGCVEVVRTHIVAVTTISCLLLCCCPDPSRPECGQIATQ